MCVMQKTLAIKIAIIGMVSLLLLIPLSMISEKIYERSQYLTEAKSSVSQSWTGKQTVMSALIVIPYYIDQPFTFIDEATKEKKIRIHQEPKFKFLIPNQLNMTSSIENDIRHKGIYKIPVYTTQIDIHGSIEPSAINTALAEIKNLPGVAKIDQAFLTTTISDPRGINKIPTLTWQNTHIAFKPGSKIHSRAGGLHAQLPSIDKSENKAIAFSFQLSLRGMEAISFIPAGIEAEVNVASNWPHPQFIGSFLPIARHIDNQGYQANWKITSFANDISDQVNQCERHQCDSLFNSQFGVKHIEAVDIYLQSERSVKYGMLFIGLSFVTFFIFEVIMKLPIHPIQYALVGFAIAVFYLLLISLSEHIDFFIAYCIASICCSVLLLSYLRFVLAGFKQATIFSAILLILYAVLYVIISAEDLALVMGAFLTFASLAIIMFTTRHINWYKVGEQFNEKDLL